MFIITPVVLLVIALAGGGAAVAAKDAEKKNDTAEKAEMVVEKPVQSPQDAVPEIETR